METGSIGTHLDYVYRSTPIGIRKSSTILKRDLSYPHANE